MTCERLSNEYRLLRNKRAIDINCNRWLHNPKRGWEPVTMHMNRLAMKNNRLKTFLNDELPIEKIRKS